MFLFLTDGSGAEEEDEYSSEPSSEFTGGSDFDEEEGLSDISLSWFLFAMNSHTHTHEQLLHFF